MALIDLTHPIAPGMTMHPGVPAPRIHDVLTFEDSRSHYAPGTEFRIASVELATSTGTYLDAPQHRFPNGTDIADLGIDRVADVPALVVDATGVSAVGADLLPQHAPGHAVLIRTDWDRHWGTEEYGRSEHPHLTAAAADQVVRSGAVLVGIDSVNIDATTGAERAVHSTLLGHGVLIVENLTRLNALPSDGALFSAVPLPVSGAPSFPVRAYARVG
ncbi:cyclase family protein [Brachybacterium sp. GCM10030267]|uniref:cyclase family protein n=1 Tax=unclassified Brachybacterium TaxID=2623841 RepID=UPI003609898A